ncbi:MAG: NADH-quinone oxidoreductase subunit F [Rhodospirillaceae bacterium]|nr:NADH-quinone oxidoreductase subunit F [Rhodospirillaceae bacterium]
MDKFVSQTETSLKKKKRRWLPKGRQVEDNYLNEVSNLFIGTQFRRDELIEYLHILQDNFGVLYDKHLVALSTLTNLPLTEIYEVATFYAHFNIVKNSANYIPIKVVRVCESLTCELFGAHKLLKDLESLQDHNIKVVPGPCMGRCQVAPTVCVGKNYVDKANLAEVKKTIEDNKFDPIIPNYINLQEYKKQGGYEIAKKIIQGKISKKQILNSLNESGLKGKGGAGFPTGKKWEIVSGYNGKKYVAVNGDEGEPGTFKDRYYLSTDPHRMIEGVLIAAHIVGIEKAYIYMRDEYPEIIEMLHTELAKVTKAGFDAHVDIELRRGAGAYICGEESAMIESIEGKRGLPRHRPPYVAETGLFGQPTLVNNIETLFWVRDILEHGAEWFNQQGKEGHPGFRTYSVSGRVKEPGLVTAAAGSTADELIAACGGMADGHHFKAYLPGGASGGILPASKADIPLDFGGSLAEEGCFVGSHAVVILSDQDNIWKAAQNLMQFFAHESCGQCTPCRSGTDKAAELMAASCPDTNLLGELAATMADASICGLGQAAPNPLLSAIKHFPEDIMQRDIGQNESLAAKAKPHVKKA